MWTERRIPFIIIVIIIIIIIIIIFIINTACSNNCSSHHTRLTSKTNTKRSGISERKASLWRCHCKIPICFLILFLFFNEANPLIILYRPLPIILIAVITLRAATLPCSGTHWWALLMILKSGCESTFQVKNIRPIRHGFCQVSTEELSLKSVNIAWTNSGVLCDEWFELLSQFMDTFLKSLLTKTNVQWELAWTASDSFSVEWVFRVLPRVLDTFLIIKMSLRGFLARMCRQKV